MKMILHQIYISWKYKIKFFHTLFLTKSTFKMRLRVYLSFQQENTILLYIYTILYINTVTRYASKQCNKNVNNTFIFYKWLKIPFIKVSLSLAQNITRRIKKNVNWFNCCVRARVCV